MNGRTGRVERPRLWEDEQLTQQLTGAVLAPLRERYSHWLSLDQSSVMRDRDEAEADIRAMQMILRIEREQPPSWHMALAAAATGAAAICLDARAEPGGIWHEAIRDYCLGHIRKVTRRARASHWEAVKDLPGMAVESPEGGPWAQIYVTVPGLVADLDRRIARLQVGGTDVPPDDEPAAVADVSRALQIWIPADTPMTLGKAMAQTGHAGMIAAALMSGADLAALRRWVDAGLPAVVYRAKPEVWQQMQVASGQELVRWEQDRILAVRDAGFTEVAAGTITCVARAPR